MSLNRSETETGFFIDKSKRVFDIAYLAVTAAALAVAWTGGFNQLPPVIAVLGAVAEILSAIRILLKKGAPLYLLIAALASFAGLYLYFLIWGAEAFGRRVWWNALWAVPAAALFGGAFMVLCDLAARTLMPPREIPIGSITALIGAPFFIYVYFSGRRRR